MKYLTTHPIHFINGYISVENKATNNRRVIKRRRKEGNVLFNDALNTFYYDVSKQTKIGLERQ